MSRALIEDLVAVRARTPSRAVALVLIALVTSAVLCGAVAVAALSATNERDVQLVALPKAQLTKCTASRLLRPTCTRLVPRVNGRYKALFAEEGKPGSPPLHVFNLEFFVASEAPPRGAHVASAAGEVWRLTPYTDPTVRSKVVPLAGPVNVNRKKPVSFGVRNWNGQRGILYLAPPYTHGGMFGDHLVYQWERRGRMYAVSLHTWWPLAETAATLKAMVRALVE